MTKKTTPGLVLTAKVGSSVEVRARDGSVLVVTIVRLTRDRVRMRFADNPSRAFHIMRAELKLHELEGTNHDKDGANVDVPSPALAGGIGGTNVRQGTE